MKLTLTTGETVRLKIEYQVEGFDLLLLRASKREKKKFEQLLGVLQRTVANSSLTDELRDLWDWAKTNIRYCQTEIGRAKSRPAKTIVTLMMGDIKVSSFSSISKEDAQMGLHSKKIGKEMAIRNLLKEMAVYNTVPWGVRHELAQRLLPISRNKSLLWTPNKKGE